jgi:predicted ATPase/class 3 adenylate cyclase
VRVSAGGPPSGVVTFLFTDIEGSTRRWEADAQSMRAALLAHDDVLRTAIEAQDGLLFSHTGDGVVAAFASPKAAVDAAVDAQRRLELPVRMGIATGEAELSDGDYLGTVLNRAARVMAAGHGGQVLVADSTAVLLSGADLADLGPQRLRDVPHPITVFQLQAPGLRRDFPPLRTLDSSPGNLRPAVTSLVGREADVADVALALREHRLVTLTGVGGVGKTRLALEVAVQLADEFSDGVWVFELAAVPDPAAVADAVAAVLGVTQQPGKTVSESVAAALEGRTRLLVFDNCEHVLDAAAHLVDAIRTQSARVRILATSREGLRLADEQLWPVPSLGGAAAVDLFVERARSVAPRVAIAETDAVAEICTRLDGIPLAIELAASRMASMTATDVRDRLDHRFKLLVGSRRDLERHQTLRHAVQWSYDLLDGTEKALLERCSVFAGGFDLQAACAVGGFGESDDYVVLDLLDALVRKSLLVVDRSGDRTRFAMLETIRQFAEERLAVRGAADDARTAQARYFAGREGDVMALWDGPRQRDAYTWFARELANLRTAFRWAADHNDLDVAATIATLAGFLGQGIENYEPATWAEELIEAARTVDHPRLLSIYVTAGLCFATGRIEDSVRYSDAAQTAIRADRDYLPCGIQGNMGGAYLAMGQPERWAELCRAQIASGPRMYLYAWASLVLALTASGSPDEAMATTIGLIEAAEATSNAYVLSFALLAYGYAWQDAEPGRALDALRRGLRIATDNGIRVNESILAMTLGRIEAAHGDPLAALECLTLAIRNYHDSGTIAIIGVPLANLAVFLDRLGHHASAATILGFAFSPMTAVTIPELNSTIARLREGLGGETYEAFTRKGEVMTTAEVVTYAYDQIAQARAELERSQ